MTCLPPKSVDPAAGTITIKVNHKNVDLRFDDIVYIEAMENYVKIYRHDLPMLVTQITMKVLASLLPADRFSRVHRSYIVAHSGVEFYNFKQVVIRNDRIRIPLGRTYADSFLEQIARYPGCREAPELL